MKWLASALAGVSVAALTTTLVGAAPALADTVPSDWQPEAIYSSRWTNVNGLQEYFYTASDQSVGHDYQTHVSGPTYSGSLGGTIKGSVAVTYNVYNQVHVVVRGSDNQIWVRWQALPGSTDQWNDSWQKMFTVPGGASSNTSAITDDQGLMEVFVRGSNGSIYTTWQDTAGGSWVLSTGSVWTSMGGDCISSPKAFVVGSRVKVFCYGTDSNRYVNERANAQGAGWTGWNQG